MALGKISGMLYNRMDTETKALQIERVFMVKKAFQVLGLALCCIVFLWFLLPACKDGYGKGSIFGQAVCLLGAFLLLFYRRLAEKNNRRRMAARIMAVCYVAGLCWAGYLTVLMNSAQAKRPPENTNIVVLGAQVLKKDEMSLALACRVDAAYQYLKDNPEAACIVTGGQGWNEPVTEASVEKYFLVKMGIAEERIFEEGKSTNTRENLAYALQIAEKENLGSTFAVVTQEFHLFRGMKLAESLGIDAYGISAKSDPLLYPAFYGGELMSLTKWHIQELLGV